MPSDTPTALQVRAHELAEKYVGLPASVKIRMIAETFGCTTGQIKTSLCTGKWRGTSDIYLELDNGITLEGMNELTPRAKTKTVQNDYLNALLAQYNPEIVAETKRAALAPLRERETRDNAIATEKGLKPYKLLTVELHDGVGGNGGYAGWYYVTLAVDGVIHAHMETGLNYDIVAGRVSEVRSQRPYFTAGALKESEVDYVFDNVGFSSTSTTLYTLALRGAVLERARIALEERNKAQSRPHEKKARHNPSAPKHHRSEPGR